MFRLAVICVLLAMSSAGPSHSHCCSIEDRQEVLALWETVWSAEFTGRRIAIAKAVFERFFDKAPDAKALFAGVDVEHPDSAEFTAHCVRVINGVDSVINLSFDPPVLHQQLSHLAEQHAAYEGMKTEYFDDFRESFAEVLPQAIPCFNVAAWNRCMKEMHEEMGSQLEHHMA